MNPNELENENKHLVINDKIDKWELKIVPTSEIKVSVFSARNDNKYSLIYKRDQKNSREEMIVDEIWLNSLFDLAISRTPYAICNYKYLFNGRIPPLSLATYFTYDKPFFNDCFIKMLFDIDQYKIDLFWYEASTPSVERQRCLAATLINDIINIRKPTPGGKIFTLVDKTVISYLVNRVIEKVDNKRILYMIMREGDWLTDKEKKKRLLLFDMHGVFNHKMML